jgi:hypothetical protein
MVDVGEELSPLGLLAAQQDADLVKPPQGSFLGDPRRVSSKKPWWW